MKPTDWRNMRLAEALAILEEANAASEYQSMQLDNIGK